MENLFLGMNVKRGILLCVEWAETEKLPTGSPQPREFTSEHDQINARFQRASFEEACFGWNSV
jgi:hypothetical protein